MSKENTHGSSLQFKENYFKMKNRILGLHHITAIAGNAKRNFEFYTKVLGLRMVKKTINFDDPGTYHFYFGVIHLLHEYHKESRV